MFDDHNQAADYIESRGFEIRGFAVTDPTERRRFTDKEKAALACLREWDYTVPETLLAA